MWHELRKHGNMNLGYTIATNYLTTADDIVFPMLEAVDLARQRLSTAHNNYSTSDNLQVCANLPVHLYMQ